MKSKCGYGGVGDIDNPDDFDKLVRLLEPGDSVEVRVKHSLTSLVSMWARESGLAFHVHPASHRDPYVSADLSKGRI